MINLVLREVVSFSNTPGNVYLLILIPGLFMGVFKLAVAMPMLGGPGYPSYPTTLIFNLFSDVSYLDDCLLHFTTSWFIGIGELWEVLRRQGNRGN